MTASGTIDRVFAPPQVASDVAARPVMLLTLNVPFAEAAIEAAIEAAVDAGSELLICDAMGVAPSYVSHMARQWAELDNRAHARDVGRMAVERGVRVQLVGFHNPNPVRAAVEVCRELGVGLLVFGADRRRLGRWSYRRAVRTLRREITCLLWIEEMAVTKDGRS
jgi:nucleotide-binding universal stress UspA family protein